jgi:7-keto-8-aminopelargonate synthetase-like enzyme
MLPQRSRPQLFSNGLLQTVAASARAAIRFVEQHPARVSILRENTRYFRESISEAGFKPLAGETPIIPIIVGETATAIRMSDMLLGKPGNNPYCHHRALEFSARGLRERVEKVADAPGLPFDQGLFRIVEEPLGTV